MNPTWYYQRFRRMALSECIGRARDAILRHLWRYRRIARGAHGTAPPVVKNWSFAKTIRPLLSESLPPSPADRLLAAAQALLSKHWLVFGQPHPDFGERPDWFVDAGSGRRAPADRYSFDIEYRNEDHIGNIKNIWEPSRHNHLTMLAAAYAATRDERYAQRIADQLHSWWRENPFLTGPHWISGIELGIRLIAWVWIRRLLEGWSGAAPLFEENHEFLDQLYDHQRWLAAFPSRGSSANNHVVAEAAGRFVSACAFPCFRESDRWRAEAAKTLRQEVVTQTFPSGLNRELATDYHGLVLELYLVAAIEGEIGGHSLGPIVWERIRAMMDALAAILDATGRPPRQGDGDDGIGLLLDAPEYNRWNALLATGECLFGALPWWPKNSKDDIRTPLWTRGVTPPPLSQTRQSMRPNLFPDAGHVYLRDGRETNEIWCRCDHGPHGFLSIAAHAHSDALAIELRVGGIDLLSDPGTYCYHGKPDWRSYFRSTLGHNTLELYSRDQSGSAGPFLWVRHAKSRLITAEGLEENAPRAVWRAEHSGYVKRSGLVHQRTVTLERAERIIQITDEIRSTRPCLAPARLVFHFGPEIRCHLEYRRARLSWHGGTAELGLSEALNWTLHTGETTPPLGWYSPSFGVKTPSLTLVGAGQLREGFPILTQLKIA
jgi:hypothetical protein